MSVLTINAFPSTATITATYNEETITGIGQVVIEANDSTVVSYTVEAQQCTSKSGTFTISGDMTEAVALNYIGSVSVDTWVPSTGRDTFPTHIAMLGKGGWRSVESNEERDAIPSARREAGMSVYVTSTNKVYILDDDLVTWNELESGKVDDVRLHNVSVVNSKIANLETVRQVTTLPVEPLIAGEIVQYIGNTNANYTNGYFYKCTGRTTTYSNIQFTPLGEYTIDVSISNNDLNTFLNETVRQIDYPVVSGRFGYYQQTPNVLWYLSGTSGHRSDGFSYSNTPEGYAEQGFTVTPPIGPQQGLDYTVENTTTWVWEQVDVQPNPTVYESFFRGKWNDWNSVPSDTQYYPEDFHNNRVPEKNDYIVLDDASGYIGTDVNYMTVTNAHDHVEYSYYDVETQSTTTGSISNGVFGKNEELKVVYTGYSNVKIYANKDGVIYNNVSYNKDEQIVQESWTGSSTWTFYFPSNTLVGSWRFRYTGEWSTDGKNGWKPEYQLENVLPIATDTEPGITKIYSTTGQNTDGTMTQKSISDAINDIQQSFFRGKFGNFTNVPTSASGYEPEPGTQDQKTPTKNDFIVVLDASDYIAPDFTEQFTFSWNPNDGRVTWTYNAVTTVVGDGTYPVTFGPDNCMYITQGGGLRVNKTSKWGATILYPNSSPQWLSGSVSYNCATTGSAGLYQGSWRFYYDGTWDVEGKTGWLPQYQVEGVLPIATDTQLGVVKVDNSTIVVDAEGTISANAIESFYRGRFDDWTHVPTVETGYEYDLHNPPSRRPQLNDYIVVNDMSDWTPSTFTDSFDLWNYSKDHNTQFAIRYNGTTTIKSLVYEGSTVKPTSEWYAFFGPNDEIKIQRINDSQNTCIVTAQKTVRYNGRIYSTGQEVFREPLTGDGCDGSTHSHIIEFSDSTERKDGTWRMRYQGSWITDNKSGWVPEYQIENTLPIADDQTLGIAKLYQSTGTNTDGAISQKGVTDKVQDLQEQIDDLKGLGRFLSVWNSSTGLPETNPETSPYEYKSGDYYLVGTVSSSTNYRPDGTSYTKDVPSTVVETEEVHVNDVYIFDGSVWKLQANSQREYTFSGIAGSPYDNANLSNALNAKQNLLTNASNAGEGIIIDDVTQEISTNNIVWRKW